LTNPRAVSNIRKSQRHAVLGKKIVSVPIKPSINPQINKPKPKISIKKSIEKII